MRKVGTTAVTEKQLKEDDISISKESLLFINDTRELLLDERMTKIPFDYVMIECNHTLGKMKKLMEECNSSKIFKYNRQRFSHLSLLGTKNMLLQLNLRKTKSIHLMHLSQEAGEPKKMKRVINKSFNIETFVCKKEGGVE